LFKPFSRNNDAKGEKIGGAQRGVFNLHLRVCVLQTVLRNAYSTTTQLVGRKNRYPLDIFDFIEIEICSIYFAGYGVT